MNLAKNLNQDQNLTLGTKSAFKSHQMNQQEQKPQADKAGKTQQPAAFPGPSAATFSGSSTKMIAPSNQQKDDQADTTGTLNISK